MGTGPGKLAAAAQQPGWRWHHVLPLECAGHHALETLARMNSSGVTAATALAQTQTVVGLDDYEVRSWPGWHHHMSLCSLAGAFLMQLQ